jgi:nucleotide-binding universal stress UspA family protein
LDRPLDVHGVPERDSSRDESEAACAIALLLEAAVPDLTEAAKEDGSGEGVARLAFVEPCVNAAAQFDALQPGEDKQGSFDPAYPETAKFAVKLGQFYKAEITLLHVLPRDVDAKFAGERLVRWTAFELGRLIPDEAPLWTTATIAVEAGEIVQQTLCTAEELRADLIVMGSNPYTAFWPIHGDNTVYNVIAEAKCPVTHSTPFPS